MAILQRESQQIYIMKALAVYSIIAAHCKLPMMENYSGSLSVMLTATKYFGEIGVPVFLVLSGRLFDRNRRFPDFLRNKCKKIVLPWMCCSLLVWIYMFIQGDFYDLLRWLLGIGNVYWYMPVLCLYFVVFYVLHNVNLRGGVFIVSIIYHVVVYDLCAVNIVAAENCVILGNFLKHMPFFLMGLLINDFNLKGHIYRILNSHIAMVITCLVLIITAGYNHIKFGDINYDSPLFLVFSSAGIIMIAWISLKIQSNSGYIKNAFATIGKESYFIYLLHLPFAGILSNILSRNLVTAYMIAFYPLFIIIILHFAAGMMTWFCKKTGIWGLLSIFGLQKNCIEKAEGI
ncbi:MAG: acyltransferase [Lachnospiraceae bacterium]|nr:acyltransferase [Lachnospiraceae bacterium]